MCLFFLDNILLCDRTNKPRKHYSLDTMPDINKKKFLLFAYIFIFLKNVGYKIYKVTCISKQYPSINIKDKK